MKNKIKFIQGINYKEIANNKNIIKFGGLVLKNLKRIGYIILIVIIAVLGFVIYSNANKGEENNQQEKVLSEIKYVESKLVQLFNEINKIESRNYSIAIGELSKESESNQTEGQSSGQSSSESGAGGGEGGTSSGEQSSSSGNSNSSSTTDQDKKKYELQLSGVLTNKEDINWDYVKGEIENLYTSIATITLDLYQIGANQDNILAFNQQIDNLSVAVKDENKEMTLSELSNLYTNLSNITQSLEGNETYKIVVRIKENIFKAYSKLDAGKWDEITNDINNAISTYSELLTDTSNGIDNQYEVNKGYILINEMQNAVKLQDVSVFLIKYKNLLEELNSI